MLEGALGFALSLVEIPAMGEGLPFKPFCRSALFSSVFYCIFESLVAMLIDFSSSVAAML